jgi:hypothetical protein
MAVPPSGSRSSGMMSTARSLKGYDLDAALHKLRSTKALVSLKGECATKVREAIAAGGVVLHRVNSAKDYGPILKHNGFNEYHGHKFETGDVIVIQGFVLPHTHEANLQVPKHLQVPHIQRHYSLLGNSTGTGWLGVDTHVGQPTLKLHMHVHGHMAMFDNEARIWISDFRQMRWHGGPGFPSEDYRKAQPKYQVYRYGYPPPAEEVFNEVVNKELSNRKAP